MTIEHVAVWANDLAAMRRFYMDWFGARSNDGYHNEKTGLRTYFLSFDSGARLELMHRDGGATCANPNPAQTGYLHLAFSAGTKERVDELTERLRAAGHCVLSGPRTTGDGYYESCVLDPEGNAIEITV